MTNDFHAKDYLEMMGVAMDWDAEHSVYGREGTETIPWLHKKPTTFKDTFTALYSYLKDAGITVRLDYDPDAVDVHRMLTAGEIRRRADNGE